MVKLLTVQEAAEYLGLSLPTIYGLLREGKLPTLRLAGRFCFPEQVLAKVRRERLKLPAAAIIDLVEGVMEDQDLEPTDELSQLLEALPSIPEDADTHLFPRQANDYVNMVMIENDFKGEEEIEELLSALESLDDGERR